MVGDEAIELERIRTENAELRATLRDHGLQLAQMREMLQKQVDQRQRFYDVLRRGFGQVVKFLEDERLR